MKKLVIQFIMIEQAPGNSLLKRFSKKIFVKTTGFSLLIKFQACSDTGIFLSIMQNFQEHF